MAAPSSSVRIRSRSLSLLAIAALLVICAGLTIGLTFAPCYSTICVDLWFPSQVHFHIALFYSGIVVTAIFLSASSKSKAFRSAFGRHLVAKPLPLFGLRLTVGGTLLTVWILALTLAPTTYWFPAERNFWYAKGNAVDWTKYMFRVVWSGVTGHWCDVMFGLVLLPVGRNSLLSTAFAREPYTLLMAHKLLAYALCACGLIHGLLYYVRTPCIHPYARSRTTNSVSVIPCRLGRKPFRPHTRRFQPRQPFLHLGAGRRHEYLLCLARLSLRSRSWHHLDTGHAHHCTAHPACGEAATTPSTTSTSPSPWLCCCSSAYMQARTSISSFRAYCFGFMIGSAGCTMHCTTSKQSLWKAPAMTGTACDLRTSLRHQQSTPPQLKRVYLRRMNRISAILSRHTTSG